MGVRVQVYLSTPMAVSYWFVSPSARPDFFAAYERALQADLAKFCAAIPHASSFARLRIAAWSTSGSDVAGR